MHIVATIAMTVSTTISSTSVKAPRPARRLVARAARPPKQRQAERPARAPRPQRAVAQAARLPGEEQAGLWHHDSRLTELFMRGLLVDFSGHFEHRQVNREHQPGDRGTHSDDDQRLKELGDAADHGLRFLFVIGSELFHDE